MSWDEEHEIYRCSVGNECTAHAKKWESKEEEAHEKASANEDDVEVKNPKSSKPGAPMPPDGPPPFGKPSPPKDKTPFSDAPVAVKKEEATKKRKKKTARSRNKTPSGDRSPSESADRSARPVAPRRSSTSESYSPRKSPESPKRSRSPIRTGVRPRESNSPKADEPLQDPKLENQTRKPRHGRERASSAKSEDTKFVPLSFIDRDDAQGFKIGPPASCYRGHCVTLGRLFKIPNRYSLNCVQCNCELVVNRIVTVCHSCEPSFIACLDCTCGLLANSPDNH
jgi:hypothetical protein